MRKFIVIMLLFLVSSCFDARNSSSSSFSSSSYSSNSNQFVWNSNINNQFKQWFDIDLPPLPDGATYTYNLTDDEVSINFNRSYKNQYFSILADAGFIYAGTINQYYFWHPNGADIIFIDNSNSFSMKFTRPQQLSWNQDANLIYHLWTNQDLPTVPANIDYLATTDYCSIEISIHMLENEVIKLFTDSGFVKTNNYYQHPSGTTLKYNFHQLSYITLTNDPLITAQKLFNYWFDEQFPALIPSLAFEEFDDGVVLSFSCDELELLLTNLAADGYELTPTDDLDFSLVTAIKNNACLFIAYDLDLELAQVFFIDQNWASNFADAFTNMTQINLPNVPLGTIVSTEIDESILKIQVVVGIDELIEYFVNLGFVAQYDYYLHLQSQTKMQVVSDGMLSYLYFYSYTQYKWDENTNQLFKLWTGQDLPSHRRA